jgi:peptide/nickel transport system permease protein
LASGDWRAASGPPLPLGGGGRGEGLQTVAHDSPLVPRPSPLGRAWRTARRNRSALLGLGLVLLVAFGALFADQLAGQSPIRTSVSARLQPPAFLGGPPTNLLGTDQLGRDLYARILHGARISLAVGLLAVLVAGGIGITLGLVAGYYGGRVDRVIMRVADIQLAFPFILLAVSIVAVLGPSLRNIVIALGLSGWVVYARVARAQVLYVKTQDYVTAARVLGAPDGLIIGRHIFPNTVSPLIVIASFAVAQMIVLESALSFLGLGVQPPTPTWGGMLNDSRDYLTLAWWVAVFPGLALTLTLLGINLVGDWLRDALDPRAVTGR